MAGYLGSKAVLLSTTAAVVTGDMTVAGATTLSGAFTSLGIDDNATSTAITIDGSQNVGIGTSSPVAPLDIYTPEGTEAKLVIRNGTSSSPVASIELRRGASSETFGADAYGDYRIKNEAGELSYEYGAGGVTTERMRVVGQGLLVGKTATATGTVGIQAQANGGLYATRDGGSSLVINRLTSTGTITTWMKDTVIVGTVSVTDSATAYNTSSDYRLKENITPIQGAADVVMAMRPCTYTAKADGLWYDGFLAHELQEVHPRAVTGTKDAMMDEEYEITPAVEATYAEDGTVLTEAVPAVIGTRSVPDMQAVDYSKLTPILTAALQEALTEIAALKVRVAALEVTP